MFNMTKNKKVLLISSISLAVIIVLGIVYAAFTQQLNINGSATGRSSKWDIHFENLSNVSLNGTAKELTSPSIDTNKTTIGDYSVSVTSPGDYVEYTFDVVNDGDYDATLTGLQKTAPSCTGTGENASTDASNVCGKLTYTLTYADGQAVSQNDTLKSKETKTMKLKLLYQTFNDDSLLPKMDVTISGLGITLTYTQDGNAKVNSDGTTPYDPYSHHVGNQITVAGETYRVIANSPVSDDYVVALKDNLLTKNEVIAAGGVAVDYINNYGAVPYYNDKWGTTSDYAFLVKSVVDNWATSKFNNSELKEVNGYSARLITISELENLGYVYDSSAQEYNLTDNVPSWTHRDDYSYWTMSAVNSQQVWDVTPGPVMRVAGNNSNFSGVRPVINVYKSAITQ